MAKPTIEDTRWAVTAAGVESTEVAVPDGALKDGGYPATGSASIPLNKDWNFWHRKAHKWFQYLNGIIDGSENWTFPANVTVTGSLTALLFPETKRAVNARSFAPNTSWDANASTEGLVSLSVTLPMAVYLPVQVGERLKALTVNMKGPGGTGFTILFTVQVRSPLVPSSTTIGTLSLSTAPGATVAQFVIPITTIMAVPADSAVRVIFTSGFNGTEVQEFVSTVDRVP